MADETAVELPFGILDGKKVALDESVWDLPEEDRVRITVQEYDAETDTFRTVRPFRFCGCGGRILDDKTFMSD